MQQQAYDFLVPALVTLALLVVTTILVLLWRKTTARKNTVLFVGLSDAGKTSIFTKLINSEKQWVTYMSMKDNVYDRYLSGSKKLKLVDYPGAESFRGELFSKWSIKGKNGLMCAIFIIDSSTFPKRVKDVAEFLYDVCCEYQSRVPILVVCNKQDIGHAKASKLIQSSLVKEFGLINVSRELALSSTSGDSANRMLTDTGKDFSWDDIKGPKIDFVECSTEENSDLSLEPIKKWISKF